MWHAAGPVRSTGRLQEAVARTAVMGEAGWQARLANAILVAALDRPASLGAHWRIDDGAFRATGQGAGSDIGSRAHQAA
jgi:L-aspartate oxidase